jgi:uncharacterized protein (DUF169 family)
MTDWAQKAEALNRLIRPLTFPIAVKLVKSVDEFPEKARRPSRDMGFKTNPCVAMTMARKYGWTVGMTADDNACLIAAYTYGWSEPESEAKKALADFMVVMKYSASENAARTTMDAVEQVKLGKGKYAGVVFSPLERTKIEPDLVMIFCNPAQLMRLVHGATQETGVASLYSAAGAGPALKESCRRSRRGSRRWCSRAMAIGFGPWCRMRRWSSLYQPTGLMRLSGGLKPPTRPAFDTPYRWT